MLIELLVVNARTFRSRRDRVGSEPVGLALPSQLRVAYGPIAEIQKGNTTMMEAVAVSNVTCAIVCAKWALDLGFSQLRQILFLIGGLLFGPLVLLVLYVFLINKARRAGQPGGQIV